MTDKSNPIGQNEFISYVIQSGDGNFVCTEQESNNVVGVYTLPTPYGSDHFDNKSDAQEHIKRVIEGDNYWKFYGQEEIPKPLIPVKVRLVMEHD